jgi:hypothetical protein
MTRNLYLDAINRTIDKMVEGIYDSLSSFDHCSTIVMTLKIGKLIWYSERLDDIVPEDFDKSDFPTINRHVKFLDHFYSEKKDFEWFKSNADDLLKRDIPSLKKNLNDYFQQYQVEGQKMESNVTTSYILQVIKDINDNLRRLVRKDPKDEKEIQDHLEDLLALKEHQFEREQVSIPYSTKKYIPDFTSDEQSIAIDVKFCNAPADERRIIDEINADIPAYKLKYQHTLFVVYDMAVIRRLKDYALGIENNNPNVHVAIIKN